MMRARPFAVTVLVVLIISGILNPVAALSSIKSQCAKGQGPRRFSDQDVAHGLPAASASIEEEPWQYRWWNIANWYSPTQMSGDFVAVENLLAGLSWGQFSNGTYWTDKLLVLPLNVAYGTQSDYVWFQFSIEFRPPTYPGPGGTRVWNIQNNIYSGTPPIDYNINEINLPYMVGHEYHFALTTLGNIATFTLADRTANTNPWSMNFNINSQALLLNPSAGVDSYAFSPASAIEGIITSGNSFTSVMFFQFRLFDIASPFPFPYDVVPSPPGIATNQTRIGASDAWYWMILMPGNMPIPRLLDPSYPKALSLGETAVIDVFATNDGGSANWQTIAISFPEGQPVTSLSIIDSDLITGPPRIWNPSETVNSSYSMFTTILVNYLVEGSTIWTRNAQHHLKIGLKPTSTGSFIFYIKSVAGVLDWTCNWDPKSGDIDQQGEFVKEYTISVSDRVIISTHFSAYYNVTGPSSTTDEYAQTVSYALEKSWTTIAVNFGFNQPPDSHMIVYLEDLPYPLFGNLSANHDPVTGWHVEFIEIAVGLELDLARTTATNEFFHAVQLAYDPGEADWIKEGMTKWAESRVYPEYTGSYSYVESVNSFMNNPDRSLPQLSNDAVLFWIFIDQYYGIGMLKNVLQQTVTKNGIPAVDAALNTVGKTFAEAFKEWTIANYFKDSYYSNGQLFNPISAAHLTYSGGRVNFNADVIDWGADYYVATSSVIYMPMQFIGGQHNNLTKILIEHGKLLISDFVLFTPYAGSYWLMQANNLDQIVIIVRSLGTETSNDRTAYSLTWLSSSQTLNGPYATSSGSSNIYVKNDEGTQASSNVNTYTLSSSSSQSSPQIDSTVVSSSSLESSSTKQVYAVNGTSQQNSEPNRLYALNDTSSQNSSTKPTTVVSNSSTIDSSQIPIEVEPISPTASFTYRPPAPVVNQTVTFDATDSMPNGGTIISDQWDFGDTYAAEGMIVTHAYANVGNCTVTLNVTDSEGAWSTISENITIYESGMLSVEIKGLSITDQNGNPKTNFAKGDVAQFDFTFENTGSLNLKKGLVSIMILDPSNTPTFLSYTFADVDPGASREFVVGYRIPFDATAGTYTMKIMVFTDWPSKGGVGLDIETSTFRVT